jgi:porphobilinogen deaminase
VDTRLAKLDAHAEWSAILLAAAGLVRLGFGRRIGQRLPPEIMLPAPGQGALAVTARSGDRAAASARGRMSLEVQVSFNTRSETHFSSVCRLFHGHLSA